MKQEYRSLNKSEFRAQQNDNGEKVITGVIVFNVNSEDLGGFVEAISPSAFDSALMPNADVLFLRDHKPSLLFGRTIAGTLTLDKQPDGLHFSCTLPDTAEADSLYKAIQRGDLSGNSFGFVCNDCDWQEMPDGTLLRTLLDVTLLEISACSFPAYPDSSVVSRSLIKSCPKELRAKISKRDDNSDDDIENASTDDAEPNDNGCQCGCPECHDNNCADCSDPDCTDENCLANQYDLEIDSNDKRSLWIKLLDAYED
jgi:uncharacterized protein